MLAQRRITGGFIRSRSQDLATLLHCPLPVESTRFPDPSLSEVPPPFYPIQFVYRQAPRRVSWTFRSVSVFDCRQYDAQPLLANTCSYPLSCIADTRPSTCSTGLVPLGYLPWWEAHYSPPTWHESVCLVSAARWLKRN